MRDAVSSRMGRADKAALVKAADAYSHHVEPVDQANHVAPNEVMALYASLPSAGLSEFAGFMHQGSGDVKWTSSEGEEKAKQTAADLAHAGFDAVRLKRLGGFPDGWGTTTIRAEPTPTGWFVRAKCVNPDAGAVCERLFTINPTAKTLHVENEKFFATGSGKGATQGDGVRMLLTQANALNGLQREGWTTTVKAFGAGTFDNPNWNGYITWPHLGYQDEAQGTPRGPHGETLEHLMSTPHGVAWWRLHGHGLKLVFDPTPGSYSAKRLEQYARTNLGGIMKADHFPESDMHMIEKGFAELMKHLEPLRIKAKIGAPGEFPDRVPAQPLAGVVAAMSPGDWSMLVLSGLREILNATFSLATTTQQFHWNVTGPRFHSLHEMFGEQYDDLNAAVDEIAERIRALKGNAAARMTEPMVAAPDADAMVQALLVRNEGCENLCKKVGAYAEKANDQGTIDLLGRRALAHGKAAWMLRSTLGEIAKAAGARDAAMQAWLDAVALSAKAT